MRGDVGKCFEEIRFQTHSEGKISLGLRKKVPSLLKIKKRSEINVKKERMPQAGVSTAVVVKGGQF